MSCDFFILLDTACVAAFPRTNRSHASFTDRSLWNANDGVGSWQALVHFRRRGQFMNQMLCYWRGIAKCQQRARSRSNRWTLWQRMPFFVQIGHETADPRNYLSNNSARKRELQRRSSTLSRTSYRSASSHGAAFERSLEWLLLLKVIREPHKDYNRVRKATTAKGKIIMPWSGPWGIMIKSPYTTGNRMSRWCFQ